MSRPFSKTLLGFFAYVVWFADIFSYILFFLLSLLIPFTIGVSVILFPVPLVLWLLSWLGLHLLAKNIHLSDETQTLVARQLSQHQMIFRVLKKVVPWFLLVCLILIGIGAVFGLLLRLLKG